MKIQEKKLRNLPQAPRILILHDRPQVLSALERMARFLRPCAQVQTASQGATAALLLDSRTYDLVVLDLNTPHMSGGLKVAAQLASSPLRNTPVVVFNSFFGRSLLQHRRPGQTLLMLPEPARFDDLDQILRGLCPTRAAAPAVPAFARS